MFGMCIRMDSRGKREDKCRCPKCGTRLTISHSLKRKSTQKIHFAVVTTRDNFQVVRVIHVEWNSRKGERAEYDVKEALQRWIDTEGNEVNIARKKMLYAPILRCVGFQQRNGG